MLDTGARSLRRRLRTETRPSHDRVDALFSSLDLTSRGGLGRFLIAQRRGFGALRGAMESDGLVSRSDLDAMLTRLDQDLDTLGNHAAGYIDKVGHVLPDAADHIVLGSRLGTEVLRRRWSLAQDPGVLAASAYFSAPTDYTLWRRHTTYLDEMEPDGDHADRLVTDVLRLFEVFAAALPKEKGA